MITVVQLIGCNVAWTNEDWSLIDSHDIWLFHLIYCYCSDFRCIFCLCFHNCYTILQHYIIAWYLVTMCAMHAVLAQVQATRRTSKYKSLRVAQQNSTIFSVYSLCYKTNHFISSCMNAWSFINNSVGIKECMAVQTVKNLCRKKQICKTNQTLLEALRRTIYRQEIAKFSRWRIYSLLDLWLIQNCSKWWDTEAGQWLDLDMHGSICLALASVVLWTLQE